MLKPPGTALFRDNTSNFANFRFLLFFSIWKGALFVPRRPLLYVCVSVYMWLDSYFQLGLVSFLFKFQFRKPNPTYVLVRNFVDCLLVAIERNSSESGTLNIQRAPGKRGNHHESQNSGAYSRTAGYFYRNFIDVMLLDSESNIFDIIATPGNILSVTKAAGIWILNSFRTSCFS